MKYRDNCKTFRLCRVADIMSAFFRALPARRQRSQRFCNYLYRLFMAALIFFTISACSNLKEVPAPSVNEVSVPAPAVQEPSPPAPLEEAPLAEPPETDIRPISSPDTIESTLKNKNVTPDNNLDPDVYEAILDVTKVIHANKSGNMRVWIGAKENAQPYDANKIVRDSVPLLANMGSYSKITPIAPDFDVNPEKSGCILIHPSGSSENFIITPRKRGEFYVSAKVELYNNDDCSGTPIPKTTQVISVSVEVDKKDLFGQLFDIFWDNFLIFWGALLALVFGAIIAFIKSKTKKTEV